VLKVIYVDVNFMFIFIKKKVKIKQTKNEKVGEIMPFVGLF